MSEWLDRVTASARRSNAVNGTRIIGIDGTTERDGWTGCCARTSSSPPTAPGRVPTWWFLAREP